LRPQYQVALIFTLVFSAYYPVISAEVCRVDDADILASLIARSTWDPLTFFLPKSSMGLYYRPVALFSYSLDMFLTGFSPAGMHIINMTLHVANAAIVFFIARRLLKESSEISLKPLVCSLLFALHPAATEAVSLLAGRTDLVACFFVLLSTYCLVAYRETRRSFWIASALGAALLGVLSKEVAFAFFLSMSMLLLPKARQHGAKETDKRKYLTAALVLFLINGALVGGVILLRSLAFTSQHGGMPLTIQYLLNDPVQTFFLFLRSIGFYVSKYIVPYPLNFAIVEVDPLFEIVGIFVTCLLIACIMLRTIPSVFFALGIIMLVPALVLVYNSIAWTPYAERYLYISIAFFSISIPLWLSFPKRLARRIVMPALTVLLVVFSATVFLRAEIWQTNFSLFKDTVQKSPSARQALIQYAYSLLLAGDAAQARLYLNAAAKHFSFRYDPSHDLVLSLIFFKEGNIAEAIEMNTGILKKTAFMNLPALENQIQFLGALLDDRHNRHEKIRILAEILQAQKRLAELTMDPLRMYEAAKLAVQLKRTNDALQLFQQTRQLLSNNHPYYAFSLKMQRYL
jgi:hypothetical protein